MSLRERTVLRLKLVLAEFPPLVLGEEARSALIARVPDIDVLAQRFSRAPEVLTLLAMALRKLGRDTDAVEIANRALAIETSWSTLTTVGSIHRAAGRTDEAVAAFERAAVLDPTDTSALMEAGRTLGESERFAEAARLFTRVVERDPRSLEARCWSAYAGWMTSTRAEQLDTLADIANTNPDFALATELLTAARAHRRGERP